MTTGISGNQGVAIVNASTMGQLTKWTMKESDGTQKYHCQAGVVAGVAWPSTCSGNRDVNGQVQGKMDFGPGGASPTTRVVLGIGSLITFVLKHKSGAQYSFNGRISEWETEADIDGGTVQPFTASYEIDGPMTVTGV